MSNTRKTTKFKLQKSVKINPRIISKSKHGQDICKVSKESKYNCSRSCAHKVHVHVPTVHSLSLSKCPPEKRLLLNFGKSVKKKNLKIISKASAYLQSILKTYVKFLKNWDKTVGGLAHCPFTFIVKTPEKRQSSNCKKVSKIDLRIRSKPHAHLQSMVKTFVKFQKNRNKTVGGVAHTRYMYPLSIHFYCQNARKMTYKFKLRKMCQKLIKDHMHLFKA